MVAPSATGVVDVADCVAGARWLIEGGRDDATFIRGGSAGGYTVLQALCDHDVVRGGACRYGISDSRSCGAETHKLESRHEVFLFGDGHAFESAMRSRRAGSRASSTGTRASRTAFGRPKRSSRSGRWNSRSSDGCCEAPRRRARSKRPTETAVAPSPIAPQRSSPFAATGARPHPRHRVPRALRRRHGRCSGDTRSGERTRTHGALHAENAGGPPRAQRDASKEVGDASERCRTTARERVCVAP